MPEKKQSNPATTVLVITVGLAFVGWLTESDWLMLTALIIGFLGAISEFLARKIDFVWMKLAFLLSLIVPNIVLSAIFFLLLWPIAALSRVFGPRDPLNLKNSKASLFIERTKSFEPKDFEKPW